MFSPNIGDRVQLCGGGRGSVKDISHNLGFPSYDIELDSGKTVTEARYRFEVESDSDMTCENEVSDKQHHVPAHRMTLTDLARPSTSTELRLEMHRPTIDLQSSQSNEAIQPQPVAEVTGDTRTNMETICDEFDDDFARWISESQEEIQKFIEGQENKGTARKTTSNLNTLKQWLIRNRNEHRNLYDIPPQELNSHLCKFFIHARKANKENYEPSTLKGMLSSFNRHLSQHRYPFCLVRSEEFAQLNMVLSSKQVQLKGEGKGNKPRKADGLTDEEVQQLYATGQLGTSNPATLLHTVWFNNTIYFGMRGVTEHHDMKWGDVKLKTDSNGDEYVAFTERATKTRSGTNPNNIRKVEPKMWAQRENPEQCPVTAYKKYSEMRPPHYMKDTDPFYIATCTVRNKSDRWYKAQPVGVNKLGSFMKTMAKAAGLTDGGPEAKRLTNHSARKYVVQKLNDAGIPSNQIMQISGHKNIQSLNDYSSMNSEQHKAISCIIGGRKIAPRPPSTALSSQVPDVGLPKHPSISSTVISSQISRSHSVQQENHTVNVSSEDSMTGKMPLFGNIYGGTFNITVNYNIKHVHKRPVNRIVDTDSDSD